MIDKDLNDTITFLLETADKFCERFNLSEIPRQLVSNEPDDRADSALFTVYQLLIQGAIAEENIGEYILGKKFPDFVQSKLASVKVPEHARKMLAQQRKLPVNYLTNDVVHYHSTREAFEGTVLKSPNIIGAVSFLFFALFLFEGFCKIVQKKEDEDPPLSEILNGLKNVSGIKIEQLRTIEFFNKYRNAWHTFGRYSKVDDEWNGIKLEDGKRLPVIEPIKRIYFLRDLFDVFFAVDDLRKLSKSTRV